MMHVPWKDSLKTSWVVLCSILLLLLLALTLFPRSSFAHDGEVVRVGIMNNKPMCYINAEGKPAGIFVSVLEYVAHREGWKLLYVHKSFGELRKQLEDGNIDILLSTAVSEERKKLYSFTATDVFNNWAEVYVKPESPINSLEALKGKRVASVHKGIHFNGPKGLRRLNEKLHLNITLIPAPDHKSSLAAVHSGKADAAVTNRLTGALYAKEFNLVKSGIVFSPVKIRFALNRDTPKTPERIEALDHHMAELIKDPNSIYHHAINAALGGDLITPEIILSKKMRLILFTVIGAFLFLAFLAFFHRWQIRSKTRELRELDAFNRQMAESAQEGIVVYDTELRFQRWNPFMEKITGKADSEVIGKRTADVIPLQKASRYNKNLQRALGGELPPSFDIMYETPTDGKTGWLSVLHSPLNDAEGISVGVISTVREISKRKQAEEDTRKKDLNLRNLLDATATVPWELDLATKQFTYIGGRIEMILGYPADSWKDMATWVERLHPEDQEEASQFCALETKKGKDHDFVYRALHQDGSVRWIRDIVSVVKDGDKPVKLAGFMHDVTKQKELTLEKENLKSRLQQAQKMEAIGTLAGGIAHDFNNILGAILGYTELAREECPENSLIGDDLDKVTEAGYRARDLVKQILAFSRQNSEERIPLQPTPLLKEVVKMLRPSLPATIEIRQDIASTTGAIMADPTQIHQIVMNLCTNAFHAMEETGGRLDISLKETERSADDLIHERDVAAGKFVQISVADSGPGIEDTIKERIFDPYFTTKETGKGTGMGLSIVHGIVKSYGGFISLYSEPGTGSVFHIFLPVAEEEPLSQVQAAEQIPMGNERVLFVDDEVMLAEMGRDTLVRLGYQVTMRTSSLEALETFQNQPDQFDLVITDQTMPGMTGVDLARRILQIRHDTPVILCTGYSAVISKEEVRSIGIREFAMKPLAKKDLAGLIRKVLNNEVNLG
jgi:PAS domain S-box-containing protein